MQIENVKIKDLNPAKYNPRKINDKQLEGLRNSIRTFGLIDPIIVNKKGNTIIGGHMRTRAAELEGHETVPVVYVDLSPAEEKALNVALNSHTISGEYDMDILPSLLEEIKLELPDMFDDLNFEDFVLPEIEIEKLEGKTDEDEVPEVVNPITKRGDVWLLGNHRLMCGDSTMIDDVEKLMNGEKADMVFTDPPYNVAFNGRSGNHDVIKNDDMEEGDFNNFINEVCQTIRTINPKAYYIWCNWKFYGVLQGQMDYKSCIVWAKNVFGMGNNYRHQHEFCLFNGDIDKDIKNESDLWNIALDSKYVHPTQKPVALSVRAFGNHSKYKTVLDLFGGSGSTLIGAEQCHKKGFIMELDEKYCDVIVNRWQNYTGKEATLESTGETYNSLKGDK